MRHATRRASAYAGSPAIPLLAMLVSALLATPASSQIVAIPVHDAVEANRSTFSDTEIQLGTLWQATSGCRALPAPTIRVLREAKGGALTFRETKLVPTSKAWKEVCGNVTIEGTAIFYKARPDYAGTDKPQIDIAYHTGITRKIVFDINVRKSTAGAKPADIEEIEIATRRSVLSGDEIFLTKLWQYGAECEQLPPPTARILKEAIGGTLSFRETKHTIKTKSGKSRCEGKTIDAVDVSYKARADFAGTDEPELEIGFRSGTTRKIKPAITVRGMKEGAQEAKIDTPLPERNFKRDVFSGNEVRVATPNNVKTDCTTGEIPDIRIVAAPEHGDLRLDTVKIAVSRPTGNSRNSCNGKEVEARAYFYKSKDGYTGDDKFTVDVDFRTGKVERYRYDMRVR